MDLKKKAELPCKNAELATAFAAIWHNWASCCISLTYMQVHIH